MSKGGVRGCRPPAVSIFYDPPLKFKSTPPPREGLFDPLAGFWIFDWRRFFFLEKNFENLTSQKKFSPAPAGQIFFSEIAKSCNFSVKIGDFLKFATPPDRGWKIFLWPPPNRIFYDPPLTQKSLLTYDFKCVLFYSGKKIFQTLFFPPVLSASCHLAPILFFPPESGLLKTGLLPLFAVCFDKIASYSPLKALWQPFFFKAKSI